MQSELARYFAIVRRRNGIRLGQLARMVGYKNVGKGANRIDRFEKRNHIHETLLMKLAAALGIDGDTVARLIEEDRQRYLQEWTAWADTPVRPVVITGHIGGFCNGETLPEGTTREAAEEYAAGVAREMKRPICLVMSRRLSIWFDSKGRRTSVREAQPGDVNVPYVRFGRRKVNIDLGSRTMKTLNEPQKPDPQPERHEVVSDFGGLRLRSSFTIIEDQPGQVSVNIEGLSFEFDDDEPPTPGEGKDE
jgi:hypothetical protein